MCEYLIYRVYITAGRVIGDLLRTYQWPKTVLFILPEDDINLGQIY